jgi:hypothetical protein
MGETDGVTLYTMSEIVSAMADGRWNETRFRLRTWNGKYKQAMLTTAIRYGAPMEIVREILTKNPNLDSAATTFIQRYSVWKSKPDVFMLLWNAGSRVDFSQIKKIKPDIYRWVPVEIIIECMRRGLLWYRSGWVYFIDDEERLRCREDVRDVMVKITTAEILCSSYLRSGSKIKLLYPDVMRRVYEML